MRTAKEIEFDFRLAMKRVTDSFIGIKSTKDTKDRLQAAVNKVAIEFYNSLTHVEIAAYDIKVPTPYVTIDGSIVSIKGIE